MVASAMFETGLGTDAVERLAEGVRAGDERAIARAITIVEQRAPARTDLLKALFPFTGRATTVGITGAPGCGKSTLTGQLIRAYRRRGESVGVIAVDPTSPFSGGAALGDRIRMQSAIPDAGVLIRSMASRKQLGGLAPATLDAASVLDAGGRDRILIETVGVGQDQVEILTVADVVVLLLVPGMGDDLQIAKAGIVEAADIFVINKSDRDGVERLEQALRDAAMLRSRPDGWAPPVIRTIATSGAGTAGVTLAVDSYLAHLRQRNLLRRKLIERWRARLHQMVRERLTEHLSGSDFALLLQAYASAVVDRKLDPQTAMERLFGQAVDSTALLRGVA